MIGHTHAQPLHSVRIRADDRSNYKLTLKNKTNTMNNLNFTPKHYSEINYRPIDYEDFVKENIKTAKAVKLSKLLTTNVDLCPFSEEVNWRTPNNGVPDSFVFEDGTYSNNNNLNTNANNNNNSHHDTSSYSRSPPVTSPRASERSNIHLNKISASLRQDAISSSSHTSQHQRLNGPKSFNFTDECVKLYKSNPNLIETNTNYSQNYSYLPDCHKKLILPGENLIGEDNTDIEYEADFENYKNLRIKQKLFEDFWEKYVNKFKKMQMSKQQILLTEIQQTIYTTAAPVTLKNLKAIVNSSNNSKNEIKKKICALSVKSKRNSSSDYFSEDSLFRNPLSPEKNFQVNSKLGLINDLELFITFKNTDSHQSSTRDYHHQTKEYGPININEFETIQFDKKGFKLNNKIPLQCIILEIKGQSEVICIGIDDKDVFNLWKDLLKLTFFKYKLEDIQETENKLRYINSVNNEPEKTNSSSTVPDHAQIAHKKLSDSQQKDNVEFLEKKLSQNFSIFSLQNDIIENCRNSIQEKEQIDSSPEKANNFFGSSKSKNQTQILNCNSRFNSTLETDTFTRSSQRFSHTTKSETDKKPFIKTNNETINIHLKVDSSIETLLRVPAINNPDNTVNIEPIFASVCLVNCETGQRLSALQPINVLSKKLLQRDLYRMYPWLLHRAEDQSGITLPSSPSSKSSTPNQTWKRKAPTPFLAPSTLQNQETTSTKESLSKTKKLLFNIDKDDLPNTALFIILEKVLTCTGSSYFKKESEKELFKNSQKLYHKLKICQIDRSDRKFLYYRQPLGIAAVMLTGHNNANDTIKSTGSSNSSDKNADESRQQSTRRSSTLLSEISIKHFHPFIPSFSFKTDNFIKFLNDIKSGNYNRKTNDKMLLKEEFKISLSEVKNEEVGKNIVDLVDSSFDKVISTFPTTLDLKSPTGLTVEVDRYEPKLELYNSFKNTFYLELLAFTLVKYAKICIKIELKDGDRGDSKPLKCVYPQITNDGDLQPCAFTTIEIKENKTLFSDDVKLFHDEIKFRLPNKLNDGHHLLFTYFTVPKPDKMDAKKSIDYKPVGFSFYRLHQNGRFNLDFNNSLKIYWQVFLDCISYLK